MEKEGSVLHQFTVAGKSKDFGSHEVGAELYKVPVGCFQAINSDHWVTYWQEYCVSLKAGVPAVAVSGAP